MTPGAILLFGSRGQWGKTQAGFQVSLKSRLRFPEGNHQIESSRMRHSLISPEIDPQNSQAVSPAARWARAGPVPAGRCQARAQLPERRGLAGRGTWRSTGVGSHAGRGSGLTRWHGADLPPLRGRGPPSQDARPGINNLAPPQGLTAVSGASPSSRLRRSASPRKPSCAQHDRLPTGLDLGLVRGMLVSRGAPGSTSSLRQ